MKVGDLVRMLPKNYSSTHHWVGDQWAGLVGVITKAEPDECGKEWYHVYIKHPDDSVPEEVLIAASDVEVINEDR
jgi:hypothetical protein